MSRLTTGARKVIRPLVPDAVMARYRSHQHSKAVRRNVDIYERDARRARRWRAFTPNTYRVISERPDGSPLTDSVTLGVVDPELEEYLGFRGSEVVVRARVSPPSMRDMRISEPQIDPLTIITTRSVLDEAGVSREGGLATTLRVLLDSGFRVGLLPEVVVPPLSARLPQVTGDAVVVMAAVPLHDIGGGSRAAQIAFELVRRGYHVIYVFGYPSSEAVDLGLRYAHPRLEEYHLDAFDPREVLARTQPGLVIVEAPIGEFIPAIEELVGAGWSMLYDVIDDWTDESLGGMWYADVFERRIVELAQGFSASARDLQAHVARFGETAVLVPNAVNEAVFADAMVGTRPPDLPEGRLIGYHGSLYGAWFDWDALASVAEAFEDHTIVVIGDDRDVPEGLPPSIRFLGLKAQGDLPAYLPHFDVGLVPFTLTDVTHAVSPLKVYEYLACGVPVAAPPLRALDGIEGVHTDVDLVAAVRDALDAPRPDGRIALATHSWGARMASMLEAVGRDLRDVEDDGARIITRPPIRYAKQDRWIRA
jgi:glycosyltransferase involved in cell wall biosynthesis